MSASVEFTNVVEMLQVRARQKPSAPAYTFLLDDEGARAELTFGELDRRARDIAARLQSEGAAGQRVLLLYPPGIEYIAGFFGCLYAGAVAVPVYPPRLDRPLNRFWSILKDAEPAFALATDMVCSMAQGALGDKASISWLATDSLDGSQSERWSAPKLNPEALAFLQYTSGSTSDPKGVMVSHGNLLHNQGLIQRSFGTDSGSRVVGWLPLYHDMGLIGNVLHPLYLGTHCVLLSPLDFLGKPLRWLKAIHDFQGTVSGGPNFAFDLCVRKISPAEREALDLSGWQVAFNGAEPIRQETVDRFAEAFRVSGFRKEAFVPCYGLAEATLLVSGGKPRPLSRRFQTAELERGRAVEAEEGRALVSCGDASFVRIVDGETGEELPEGAVGEIWVVDASVARGYWRRPEVNEATFRARTRSGAGPCLRTGDLGFVLAGELYVAGRIKDLVIIRGRNHYPQDIELTAEKSHPALRPGCGAAFSVEVEGEERLVVVNEVSSETGLPAAEIAGAIRQAIAAEHELQVHCIVLIAPRSIPKTSSGKIQRRACRAAFLAGELQTVSQAIVSDAEPTAAGGDDVAGWLAARVARCAGIPAGGIDLAAPVSRYALDSLQVVELSHDLEETFGARIPIEVFFGSSSLRDVAARIGSPERHAPEAQAAPAQPAGDAPLSEGQRALWLLSQLEPESGVYNVPGALKVSGALDAAALRRAFDALAQRHPILLTTFPAVGGEPVQRVNREREVPFVVEPASESQLPARLAAEASRPFRLDQEVPIRVHLFAVGRNQHVLLVALHHLATDLWSEGLLLRELAALYAAERDHVAPALAPVKARFQDYVAWQSELLRGARGEELAAYWLDQLGGELPVLALPTARPRPPVQSYWGAAVSIALDAELSAGIKRLARERQATPFMVLMAAYQALLHRYTGQEDVIVGTVTAGRSRAAFAEVPGYFVNSLAIRSHPRGALAFEALLDETRRSVLGAFEHQDYPFATLVQRLRPARDPSRSPIFQAMFALQKGHGEDADFLTRFALGVPGARLPWAGLTLEALPLEQRIAQFDLTLTVGEVEGQFHASFDYCSDLFEAAAVRELAEHFRTLLGGIVRAPSRALAELPLLTDDEVETQVIRWNDTARPYPAHASVHEWIERCSREHPEAAALVYAGAAMTYGELDRRSNQLAHRLVREGVGPEKVVGISLERGADLVVALLAVLKTGAAFLPVDPQYPADRIQQMLGDSRAALVLAQDSPLLAQALAGESAASLGARIDPMQAACIVYTSGSTGRPKGTVVDHRSLVNLVASFQECYRPTAADRILPVTSIASISFVGEVLPLLCSGGALVIPSREEMLDESKLRELIASSGVTILSTLPSRLGSLRDAGETLAKVRLVLSGGEALLAEDVPGSGSRTELVNGYGLTETCACSTYYPVHREDLAAGRPVALGKPIRNTQIYVLDRELRCVPVGCAGELFISGDGLARGYHGRPDATAERFLPNPFIPGQRMYRTGDQARWRADGNLEFLGRVDHQVKVRGHRIELEEIESALKRHPALQDVVVTVHGERSDEKQLVAYVVPGAAQAPSPEELLAFVRERLPEQMVPAFFIPLQALPRSPNGKVDRSALPEPERRRPALATGFVAPQGELERRIAEVWKAALRVDEVGLNDNFFDLGGHSLLLAKVHAQLKEALQRPLTLVDLFRFPTVGSLAAHLGQQGAAAPAAPQALARRPAASGDDGIAIIGMSGRFPGASNPKQLWRNLVDGVESISFFTDDELIAAGIDPELLKDPGYVKANGIIENLDQLDAGFFRLSPRDAELMDPQHRVFLECAWEALESAGYDPSRYPGRVGVFGGTSMNTYMLMNLLPGTKMVASLDTLAMALGNDKDTLTTRVSYKFGLKGPSIAIQSASSTSLVAVHVACQMLLAGDCEMALAGGASIHLPEKSGYMYQVGGTTAKDGHCRAFDADATGFVSGKGAGVVLLKRLADALRDGDHIHAVVRGSACNNDGALKVSWTAPSVEGQVDVYREALAAARLRPRDVGYIECHGTGTAMGDPIEIAALTEAFAADELEPGSVAIGSLKTNIGHLDTAAGVVGLIKAALCVEHGKLVPTLHFKRANPEIDFEKTPFVVNTAYRDWGKSPRIAGVTSLGMGGTNAHVIVAEPPAREPSGPSREHQLLLLSAATSTALDAAASNLAAHLEENPAVPLADVAWVLQAGRQAFKHRRVAVCRTREEAIEALRTGDLRFGAAGALEGGAPSLAFMFPGQGAQYVDMAAGLYESEPVFRAEVDRACERLVPELGFDLRTRLYPPEGIAHEEASRAINQTQVTQPALFVVEYALARLLMSWGIRPQALIGHSVGEYVAACLADVFSLEDAVALVAARGRLMQQMPAGSMLAVPRSAEQVKALLGDRLCVATINEPDSCVVSGPTDDIEALEKRLAAEGVKARRLHTSHAFHSSMLDPAVGPFRERVAQVRLSPPKIPFISNLTGTWITDAQCTDPGYWAAQMRQAVQFAAGVAALLQEPRRVCVEVGPGQTLASFVRSNPARKASHEAVSLMRHPKDTAADQAALLRGVGRLWIAGVALDDQRFFDGQQRRRVPLPTYPFQRKRHWVDPKPIPSGSQPAGDVRQPATDWYFAPVWKQAAGAIQQPRPRSTIWVLSDGTELSGGLIDALRKLEQDVVVLRAGTEFSRVSPEEALVDPVDAAAYERAFDAMPAPDRVVVMSTAASQPTRAVLDRSFFAPVALMQAHGRRASAPPFELVIVTAGAHDVVGTEGLQPVQASVLGACGVIPLEYPGVRCRNVDLGGASADSAGALAEELLRAGSGDVALRHGRRWLRTFENVRGATAASGAARLREGGVYLITGGLGGMGLSLATSIARGRRVKLVLMGRTGLPPRSEWPQVASGTDETAARIRRVLELEQQHQAQVEIVTGDVAREADVRAAVDRAVERFGALHGVLHAAGIPGGGLIQLRGRAASDAVLSGKLEGALALDAVLAGRSLDFVALCSSITAVVPMPGQADYVAANAALDALAQARARQGLPWVSINWDAWREVGMGVRVDADSELAVWRERLTRDGLSNAEGGEGFLCALGTGLGQVILSTHPLAVRLSAPRALGVPEPQPKKTATEVAATNLAKAVADAGDLEQRIVSIWQEMLGVPQVGLHDNFFDLGGTSLVGIKILGRLRAELGVDISEVALFQAPTVSTLANLIRGAEGGPSAATDAQARGQRRRERRRSR